MGLLNKTLIFNNRGRKIMKTRYAILLLTFCLFLGLSIQISYAQWDAINSGYGITTNWHGKEVPFGESVTAWAGTRDPSVTAIFFRWKRPDNSTYREYNNTSLVKCDSMSEIPSDAPEEIKNWAENNPDKFPIWIATNTQIPDTIGEWAVKAYFIGPNGTTKEHVENTIMIRGTSFNVISDFPLVGTAGALVAMLLGLNLFMRRKR
jgi:hypothetical protein